MTVTPDVLDETIVLVGEHPGVTVIPAGTVLTRLNPFDGMLLRSESLRVEQEYVRTLAALANVAGGSGVVHGFDADTGGKSDDRLVLGPGHAVSPSGRPLVLPQQVDLDLQQIIDRSTRVARRRTSASLPYGYGDAFGDCEKVAVTADPGATIVASTGLWVIAIGAAEALCGHEDVYGKLCEEACVTSSDRPYRLEGVVVVALPLRLTVPIAKATAVSLGAIHQRSLVASAAFATERAARPDLRSRSGLESLAWCLGAHLEGADDLVPIALVARAGTSTQFLDAWTVRRERIETPPRRYWAPRMGMRPYDVFLAQVLQFQCQLRDGLGGADDPGMPTNPCVSQQQALDETLQYLGEIAAQFTEVDVGAIAGALKPMQEAVPGGASRLADVRRKVVFALGRVRGGTGQHILVDRGIVELPPAGFLPVVPGTTQTIDVQVRALMGAGVDLRFCVTRPDVVAHALEEAQHMDRISLLTGLDKPDAREQVDVLVPDGELVDAAPASTGSGFDMTLQLAPAAALAGGANARVNTDTGLLRQAPAASALALHGAARAAASAGGGGTFRFAGITELAKGAKGSDVIRGLATLRPEGGAGATVLRRMNTVSTAEVSRQRTDAGFAMRMQAIGAEASRQRTRVSAGAADAEAAEAPVKFATRAVGDVVSLWLDASCKGDPFSTAGEPIGVQLLCEVTTPASQPTVLRLELRGDLIVKDVLPAANGGRRMTGRLECLGSRSVVVSGSPGQALSGHIALPVTLESGPDTDGDAGATLTVMVTKKVRLRIQGIGSAKPLTIRVLASAEVPPKDPKATTPTTPLAIAILREDAKVGDSSNAVHRLSRSALAMLGAALGDASFAAEAARVLFPPAAAQPARTSVRGTRDWVLFHRRRTITCAGAEAAKKAPVAPARLEVYAFHTADAQQITKLQSALNGAVTPAAIAALARFDLVDLGRIEFAGETADLLTPVEALQADWQGSSPGESLVYGAIAETAAADDATLLDARTQRVIAAVGQITPPRATLDTDVLVDVPPPLVVPGTEGVVVLASLIERTTTCMTVFRVHDELADTFIRMLASDSADQAFKQLDGGFDPLGVMTFAQDSAVPESDKAVRDAWTGFANDLQTVTVFSHANDDAAGDESLREQRGLAIASSLNHKDTGAAAFEISGQLPGDCPAIALLVRSVGGDESLTCHTVKLLAQDKVATFHSLLKDGDESGLLALSKDSAKFVAGVRFATVTSVGGFAQDRTQLKTSFPAAASGSIAVAAVLSRAGDGRVGSAALRKRRAQEILATIGQDAAKVELVEADDTIPASCPVVTLLVPG